jgi:predicted DNA binding protein
VSIIAEFYLPVTAFPPGSSLWTDVDVTVELEPLVPLGRDSQYLWVIGDEYPHAVDVIRTMNAVESVETLDTLPDRALLRVRWSDTDTPLVDLADEEGAIVTEAVGTADGWTVSVRFPDDSALAAFYDGCRQRGIQLEFRGIYVSDVDTSDGFGMSPVQRETVEAAFEMGYFDVPRGTTIAAIAEVLDVSEQAVSERLRRGLANYLTTVIDAPSTDGPSE